MRILRVFVIPLREQFGIKEFREQFFANFGKFLGEDRAITATVAVRVRGCGRFGAYSSQEPIRCSLDSSEVEFSYDSATGFLTIPVPEMEMYRWNLEIQV